MIYAIGDLHLSFSSDKPMNVFGENWNNYEDKIKQNWIDKVKENDLILLPGDFSWSMNLNDTYKDFEFISNLPGQKILLKGNHDYWWETLKKMNNYIEECKFSKINFLFNNSFLYENTLIVGTRGWSFNEDEDFEKMQNREAIRLENSIQYGISNYKFDKIICMMHYPPITKQMIEQNIKSPYIEIMKKYDIKKCVYGHLHGKAHDFAVEGNAEGIDLKLVSSDFLKFDLYKIEE